MSEITTAGELDALPVGSVVLTNRTAEGRAVLLGMAEKYLGWAWQKDDNGDWWSVDSNFMHTRRFVDYLGPVTLIYRPDAPALSDAALVEEAARRGMTVMDAAEAARLRAEVERLTEHSTFANHISWRIAEAVGDVPEGAESIEGDPDEQLTRLIAERDHLRAGIEALADEWERARVSLLAGGVGEGLLSFRDAAARLRALLSADDEAERP